jgi:[NiFe] hydrogenase diaphorase moiety small subunit
MRASRDVDGKNVFQFVGRGRQADRGERGGAAGGHQPRAPRTRRVDVCPVGAILEARRLRVPIGQREYDKEPIGSEIEPPRRLVGR